MKSLRFLWALAVACAACAPIAGEFPDGSPDVSPIADARADDSAPRARADTAPARPLRERPSPLPPLPPLPAHERCASMDEVGLESLRTSRADDPVLTYERTGITPTGDRSWQFCSGRAQTDGLEDAHVKFTAPRAGLWRLIAEGEGLRSLLVIRRCEPGFDAACRDAQSALSGRDLRARLAIEVDIEQGESYELSLDGCPPGARCAWSVRAERWDGLRCPYVGAPSGPCTSSQRCSVDARGARFQCEDIVRADREASLSLSSTEALIDRASGALLVRARYAQPVEGRATVIVSRWLQADGVTAIESPRAIATRTIADAQVEAVFEAVDPRASFAEVWLSTDRATLRQTVRFEPWSRLAIGQRCARETTDPCERGAWCDEGVCASDNGAEIRDARAYVAPRTQQVSLLVTGRGSPGSSLSFSIASRAGLSPWRDEQYPIRMALDRDGDGTFVLDRRALEVVDGATELRVSWVDGARGRSGSRLVPIERATVLGLAGDCGLIGAACDAGLECQLDSHGQRCRPALAVPTACVAPDAFEWSPREDASRITGEGYGVSSSIDPARACEQPVHERDLRVSFVAPSDGRYQFVGRAIAELVATRSCEQSVCSRGAWGDVSFFEREMRRGERWLFSVRPVQRAGEFWVEMRRGEAR